MLLTCLCIIGQKALPDIPSLLEIILDEIGAHLDNGLFTSADLVRAYVKRIKKINQDALNIAEKLDLEAMTSGRRGPLHGVPILLKDNIVTLDNMEATAGSYALIGAIPHRQATVATKLQGAGAIILGKTSMVEWANLRWTNAPTGWCPRGGQVTGPFCPNMVVHGSSTGSAVATCLGLAFAALGTETDGSICNPASACNLVGLKPTTGLVSRDGVIPGSNRLDIVGPLIRNVIDAAAIFSIIAGETEHDTCTYDIPFNTIPDYTQLCRLRDLSGVRIGISSWQYIRDNILQAETKAFEATVKVTKSLGAEVVDNIELPAIEKWTQCLLKGQMSIRTADMAENLEAYFTKCYPCYVVETFEFALDKEHYESSRFQELEVLREYMAAEGGIPGALDGYKLDVLMAPQVLGFVTLSSFAGSPLITVPLGFYGPETLVTYEYFSDMVETVLGVPVSIYFFAGRFEEQTLLRVAYAFEPSHTITQPPKMYNLPVTDLKNIVSERKELETQHQG
ncbi:glutamyl-tRNA amidotransferase subunit A [Xylariaceae sp. FL0255]|nr:glutamyl-tRNA amidotransferase subunit A [Xylariaceae sp. FL0255]